MKSPNLIHRLNLPLHLIYTSFPSTFFFVLFFYYKLKGQIFPIIAKSKGHMEYKLSHLRDKTDKKNKQIFIPSLHHRTRNTPQDVDLQVAYFS